MSKLTTLQITLTMSLDKTIYCGETNPNLIKNRL